MVTEVTPTNKRPRKSHIFIRIDGDFYSEPSCVSERLLAVEPFVGLVWDPASGLGTILKSARDAGLSNFASDIAEHGQGLTQDFLTAPAPTDVFSVVTNPPFKLARAFVERALKLGAKKTAIIFPTARLNAAHWLARYRLPACGCLRLDRQCHPEKSLPAVRRPKEGRRISVGWF